MLALDLTGFRLMWRVAHGRSRRLLVVNITVGDSGSATRYTIAFALQQWHVALIQHFQEDHLFSRTGQAFFSFASFLSFFSFSFSLFFFGTRLLTLRNLRYVATRLLWQSSDRLGVTEHLWSTPSVAIHKIRELGALSGIKHNTGLLNKSRYLALRSKSSLLPGYIPSKLHPAEWYWRKRWRRESQTTQTPCSTAPQLSDRCNEHISAAQSGRSPPNQMCASEQPPCRRPGGVKRQSHSKGRWCQETVEYHPPAWTNRTEILNFGRRILF